jgi:hypothetical protein
MWNAFALTVKKIREILLPDLKEAYLHDGLSQLCKMSALLWQSDGEAYWFKTSKQCVA